MIAPTWQTENITLYAGDCLHTMRELETFIADAAICEPPFPGEDSIEEYSPWIAKLVYRLSQAVKPDGFIIFWAPLLDCYHWSKWYPEGYQIIPVKRDIGQLWDPIVYWLNSKEAVERCENNPYLESPCQPLKAASYFTRSRPVKVLKRLIDFSSLPGDTILDPCMGHGSTGLACLETGRKFIGVENDVKTFEVARDQLSEQAVIEIAK